jgi:hypothetical protein
VQHSHRQNLIISILVRSCVKADHLRYSRSRDMYLT